MHHMLPVEKVEKDNKLYFSWTKHLFFFASILIVLTIAIVWLVVQKTEDISINPIVKYVPFFVITPISLIIWFVGFHFSQKDINLIKVNISKRTLAMYFLSNIIYCCEIILITILFLLFEVVFPNNNIKIDSRIEYIILLVISGTISLFSITFYRYSVYRIEYEIYKKRYSK
ncbi:MAG: hypothetical protein LBB39_01060 [Mycoplasmataceae bacterium]|nr:hypothetical protein [Mycoplasmataceae bacterium]